ncbi:pilus assembly protein [Pontixanthobacter gangjinensis]|uniref:Pilus assembly protein n=1 Tax=Pontixanthobacter gangjinensis TaxID=1028742 RepID=A0A6I4SMK1_9SPHN|nr:pilus assembly protein TadG-related protein [Pontixanthobacter gangjinensis]MXO56953.1 pilus assembly protein [Pontixanthobacter gangjinensis]
MRAVKKLTKSLKNSKSGNATLLVALGLPALIGGAGFAVDTAQWYMWQRELQHSVDQAAYAGAWALAREDSEDLYLTRAKQEFDANLAKTSEFASDPTIRVADFAGGTGNSVVVTATASKSLPFSSFLMKGATTIRATAQASFAEGYNFNACLVSLAENGTGTTIGGNATVRAQCGIAALSCDENAISIDGSANVSTDVIVACGTIDAEDSDTSVVENVTGLKDIYADLEPPTNDTNRTYECAGKGNNKQASLRPGTYPSLVVSCTTTLSSGIYVINGGTLDLAANYNVTGSGVMFILKNGAEVKLGGTGNENRINLTPMSAGDFVGTDYEENADRLSDILIFEARDNNPSADHILNGNSNSVMEGLIYLPSGTLRINGTSNVTAQCLQISANRIDIRGNATLETLCPTNETTSVGNSTPNVKLVK